MRAWGADPNLGHTLVTGLASAGYRVVSADYEGHLMAHPQPETLTAENVARDLMAIADAAGASRYAYYGYSWLALAGLQLALRDPRLTGLAMGGFPPLDGPYEAMLTVTAATHRMATTAAVPPAREAEPGDWDSVQVTQSPAQTQQFLTLYQSLQSFDDRAATTSLTIPGLAFAGEADNISYGAQWDNAKVRIADALRTNQPALEDLGWEVAWLPGDHMAAMQATAVLPVLTPWLGRLANS